MRDERRHLSSEAFKDPSLISQFDFSVLAKPVPIHRQTAGALGIFSPEYGHKKPLREGGVSRRESFPEQKETSARWSITGPMTSIEPYTIMLASRHAVQSTRYREASLQRVCT
jgi:hypothetical protein